MNLPSLNQDQIKKVMLSGFGFVFLLYVYFTFFLGPLNKSRRTAQAAIADVQHKIETSKGETAKTAILERQAKDLTGLGPHPLEVPTGHVHRNCIGTLDLDRRYPELVAEGVADGHGS